MSDPVTNVDIEDVLASIRRLVLQAPPEDRPATPVPGPLGRGRLVLTQALRVEEEPEPDRVADDDSWAEDAIGGSEPEHRSQVTDGEAPRWSDAAGPSVDTHHLVAEDAPDAIPATPAGDDPAALPPLVLSSPLRPGRATDLRTIEAALTEADVAWEPDGSEAEAALDWSVGGMAAAPAAVPLFRHRSPFTPEPERPSAAPAGEASAGGGVGDAPTPTVGPAPSPGAVDDDRLRALVTEVLRAELQGELGERITRNVRKLVRREIFRILETRDED